MKENDMLGKKNKLLDEIRKLESSIEADVKRILAEESLKLQISVLQEVKRSYEDVSRELQKREK